MTLLAAILANVLLLVAALGFGSSLWRFIPQKFSLVDRLAITLLGGLGLLGTLLFALGEAWFSRTAIATLLIAGIVLGFVWLAKNAGDLRLTTLKIDLPLLPTVIVASVLLLTMVAGLAEPTGDIKLDAIAYHFLGPKVWLRRTLIRPVTDEALTAFPAVAETQFAALMCFGGARAPELYAVTALLALLLVTLTLARRSGLDGGDAWWTAAIVFTMPVVYRGAFGGFVDVLYSAFVLAAARIGLDGERRLHYALFGVFCGFAIGTKYTGLIATILLAATAFVAAVVVRGQHYKTALGHLGIACVAAAIVGGPWYLRNWIVLGCPIYPPPTFLLHYFHPKYLSLDALQHLQARMWREGTAMGRGPISFLLLPFHLTYRSANFINGVGGIGLTPLALAPFGVVDRRKDWFTASLALFTVLQTVAWFVTAQEARYLIHGYLVAGILAVCGWRYVVRAAPKFGPLLAGSAVACSVLYGFFMICTARAQDLRAVTSDSYAQKRRAEEIPFLASFDYLNHDPSVGKVLILDPRVPSFYSDRDYLKPIGRLGERTLPGADDLSQVLSQLQPLHISHILDVHFPGQTFRLPEQPQGLTLVFQRPDQRVYRVN